MKKSLNKKDYNSLKSLDGPLHQLIKNNHVTTIFISSWCLTAGINFINVLPECAKKTVKSVVSFGAFGTYERKSCM